MNARPQLVVVGGFLGAGKTTLILAAARLLAERGLRSAIILNDQSESLVDTELVRSGVQSAARPGATSAARPGRENRTAIVR